jgi:hypothetical protein
MQQRLEWVVILRPLMPAQRKAWAPIVARAAEIVEGYETAVTLRQVFYRLVAEGLLANKVTDYNQLSDRTAKRRREGTFPELIDPTRSIERPLDFSSPADALNWLAARYRRDRLEEQPVLPVIVVEKATLVAQLYSWFGEPWSVPIAALRGYASESYERTILNLVEAEEEEDDLGTTRREVELIYCGDFDPSGEDIPRSFQDKTGLTLRRVALDWEQVLRFDLPPAMGKASDSRAAAFLERHGRLMQVELEALPPEELQALLRAELEALLDVTRIEEVQGREDDDREALGQLADEWEE